MLVARERPAANCRPQCRHRRPARDRPGVTARATEPARRVVDNGDRDHRSRSSAIPAERQWSGRLGELAYRVYLLADQTGVELDAEIRTAAERDRKSAPPNWLRTAAGPSIRSDWIGRAPLARVRSARTDAGRCAQCEGGSGGGATDVPSGSAGTMSPSFRSRNTPSRGISPNGSGADTARTDGARHCPRAGW